jgi:hypothetical protein
MQGRVTARRRSVVRLQPLRFLLPCPGLRLIRGLADVLSKLWPSAVAKARQLRSRVGIRQAEIEAAIATAAAPALPCFQRVRILSKASLPGRGPDYSDDIGTSL